MTIALWICFSLLLFMLICLAIPVEIIVSVQRRESVSGKVIIAWLFGLIRYTPEIDRSKTIQEKPPKKTVEPQPASPPPSDTKASPPPSDTEASPPSSDTEASPETDQGGSRFASILEILRTPGFMKRIIKLGLDLFKRVRVRILFVQGRIGLGDPADTGRLWGFLCAMTGMLMMAHQVTLEPDFEQAIFEIDGQGAFRIIPLQIILIFLLFLLSPPILRVAWTGMRTAIRARRKRKRDRKMEK